MASLRVEKFSCILSIDVILQMSL